MKETVEMIAKETDKDIGDFMLSDNPRQPHKNWELLHDAPMVMLRLQELRDRKSNV